MFPGLQRVPAGTGLADHKYVVTEYFVSGTASGKPYTTRILVRQPDNPSRFSGIVVAEPMHASGNSWMFYFTRIYMMRHGHISVEIAPQKAGTEDDDRQGRIRSAMRRSAFPIWGRPTRSWRRWARC